MRQQMDVLRHSIATSIGLLVIVYYSWVIGAGIWLLGFFKGRRARGAVLVALGALVQVGAHLLHLAEWRRLRGEPDGLYVWIAPLVIALLGTVLWVAGVARQNGLDRGDG